MRIDSQIQTHDNLRNDQFALVLMNKQAAPYKIFPVDTADNTRASLVEFENYYTDLTEEEQKTAAFFLKESCLTWGISPSRLVYDLGKEAQETNSRQDVPVTSFAPGAGFSHFALGGHYAIDTEDHIKQAMEYFHDHYRGFSGPDRCTFAANVVQRAGELNVGIDEADIINKYASPEYDLSKLKAQLLVRQDLSKTAADKSRYETLAKFAAELTPSEFADLLGEIDSKNGITRSYNKHIMDPYESTLMNKAASISFTIESDGNTYNSLQVKKAVSNPEVAKLFGSGVAKQLQQDPAIILSLPKVDQETILSYV